MGKPLQCAGAFNIARAAHELTKGRAAASHVEDQVQQKRCVHRPNEAVATEAESV
jgi:methylisocitrate lyase